TRRGRCPCGNFAASATTASSLPACRSGAASATKRRAAERDRRSARSRSMNTVRDESPIVTRNAPTIFAGSPIVCHISPKLKPMRSPFLGGQFEGDLDDPVHGDRLALEARGRVLPALHGLHGRAHERLLAAHHLHLGDGAVG